MILLYLRDLKDTVRIYSNTNVQPEVYTTF